jgi:hypothetical protein
MYQFLDVEEFSPVRVIATVAKSYLHSPTPNNLRLIVQPLLLFGLIHPWLDIFPNSYLLLGFNHLINAMNQFKPFYASG